MVIKIENINTDVWNGFADLMANLIEKYADCIANDFTETPLADACQKSGKADSELQI